LLDDNLPPLNGLFFHPAGLRDREEENIHQGHPGNQGGLRDRILYRLTCTGVGTVFRVEKWHPERE
jgi:hypothetical protein